MGHGRLIQRPLPAVSAGMQVASFQEFGRNALRAGRDLGIGRVRHGAVMRDDDEAAIEATARPIGLWPIAARQDRAAFAALFAFYAPRIKTMLMRTGASADAARGFRPGGAAHGLAQGRLFRSRRAPALRPGFIRSRAICGSIACATTSGQSSMRCTKLSSPRSRSARMQPSTRRSATSAFAARSANCRRSKSACLQLSFFEGRAHGDIARTLDLPLGTVKSRLRLAMSRLRNSAR